MLCMLICLAYGPSSRDSGILTIQPLRFDDDNDDHTYARTYTHTHIYDTNFRCRCTNGDILRTGNCAKNITAYFLVYSSSELAQ